MRAGGGSLSQNGTQIGKGVEIPECASLPALRSLTDAFHWPNPTRSQLARVLKSHRHTWGLWGKEQSGQRWRIDKEVGDKRKWEVRESLFYSMIFKSQYETQGFRAGGDFQLEEMECVKPLSREKNVGIIVAKAEGNKVRCEVGPCRCRSKVESYPQCSADLLRGLNWGQSSLGVQPSGEGEVMRPWPRVGQKNGTSFPYK